MLHYAKTRRKYASHNKSDRAKNLCAFCGDENLESRLVEKTKTMRIIPNRVSYDIFEGLRVEDHLMIVPIRHVEGIAEFTDQEKCEMTDLLGKYEQLGYSMYARGVGSISRSVKHQHTHLIKLSNTLPKFSLYMRKPYILIHK